MTHEFVATEQTFWIAHTPSLSYGVVQAGERISSGQEYLETFERRLPWRARVFELGGDPDLNAYGSPDVLKAVSDTGSED